MSPDVRRVLAVVALVAAVLAVVGVVPAVPWLALGLMLLAIERIAA